MTTPTLNASPVGGLALSTRRLSLKVLLAIPVVCVAFSLLIFAITPFQGRADFLVFFLLTYLTVQTVVSGLVEGRRRAVDRFIKALVIGAFLAAIAQGAARDSRGMRGVLAAHLRDHPLSGTGRLPGLLPA
ncbi:MAG TPA: hypothetical protein VHX15_17385, partial [Frankiaceae bacterium]|nr:hypothetical protein [Frankiaceae bacterium]